MALTYIYLAILAVVLALVVAVMFGSKKPSLQATAAMVIVPLVLRLLMIK